MQSARHGPAPDGGGSGGWGGVAGAGPTTVDEASMERSKSFIKALQVLPEHCIPNSRSHSSFCTHKEEKYFRVKLLFSPFRRGCGWGLKP